MWLFLIPVKNISKSLNSKFMFVQISRRLFIFSAISSTSLNESSEAPRPIHTPSLSPVVIISFVSLKSNQKFNRLLHKDHDVILRPFLTVSSVSHKGVGPSWVLAQCSAIAAICTAKKPAQRGPSPDFHFYCNQPVAA